MYTRTGPAKRESLVIAAPGSCREPRRDRPIGPPHPFPVPPGGRKCCLSRSSTAAPSDGLTSRSGAPCWPRCAGRSTKGPMNDLPTVQRARKRPPILGHIHGPGGLIARVKRQHAGSRRRSHSRTVRSRPAARQQTLRASAQCDYIVCVSADASQFKTRDRVND